VPRQLFNAYLLPTHPVYSSDWNWTQYVTIVFFIPNWGARYVIRSWGQRSFNHVGKHDTSSGRPNYDVQSSVRVLCTLSCNKWLRRFHGTLTSSRGGGAAYVVQIASVPDVRWTKPFSSGPLGTLTICGPSSRANTLSFEEFCVLYWIRRLIYRVMTSQPLVPILSRRT
jgi:hypothetical protein